MVAQSSRERGGKSKETWRTRPEDRLRYCMLLELYDGSSSTVYIRQNRYHDRRCARTKGEDESVRLIARLNNATVYVTWSEHEQRRVRRNKKSLREPYVRTREKGRKMGSVEPNECAPVVLGLERA